MFLVVYSFSHIRKYLIYRRCPPTDSPGGGYDTGGSSFQSRSKKRNSRGNDDFGNDKDSKLMKTLTENNIEENLSLTQMETDVTEK